MAKYSRTGNSSMEENAFEDEEETEVSFNTVYKNPIIERDEKINSLQKQTSELNKEIPTLKENWRLCRYLTAKKLRGTGKLF